MSLKNGDTMGKTSGGKATKTITVTAPAKLNLTLEVLRRRNDGFHEIISVIQTIRLGDSLTFRTGENIRFYCEMPGWSAASSLVSRAAALLQARADGTPGATIEIAKRIPLSSGLGGDSSDAAAVLTGLNRLWELALPVAELEKIAARLGSDVPLFLQQGTLLAEGRGEKITPLPTMPDLSVILLLPDIKIENKTRQIYARLTPADFTAGQISRDLAQALITGHPPREPGLYNVFDTHGFNFFPGLAEQKRLFHQAGAREIHLAGAGHSLFTLEPDAEKAAHIQTRLEAQGLPACLTSPESNPAFVDLT
jgi:4-diphosphocytidyl-2-C-methyl-D-erythritol kinase